MPDRCPAVPVCESRNGACHYNIFARSQLNSIGREGVAHAVGYRPPGDILRADAHISQLNEFILIRTKGTGQGIIHDFRDSYPAGRYLNIECSFIHSAPDIPALRTGLHRHGTADGHRPGVNERGGAYTAANNPWIGPVCRIVYLSTIACHRQLKSVWRYSALLIELRRIDHRV